MSVYVDLAKVLEKGYINAKYVFDELMELELMKHILKIDFNDKLDNNSYFKLKLKKTYDNDNLIEEVVALSRNYDEFYQKVIFSHSFDDVVSYSRLVEFINNSPYIEIDKEKSNDEILNLKIKKIPFNIKTISRYYSMELYKKIIDILDEFINIVGDGKYNSSYFNKINFIINASLSSIDRDILCDVKLFFKNDYFNICYEIPFISISELERFIDDNFEMNFCICDDNRKKCNLYIYLNKNLEIVDNDILKRKSIIKKK